MRRLSALPIIAALILTLAMPATAVTEHCPDGGVKTETGDMNDVVLLEGTTFCVKGSTEATGLLTADGVTTLFDYLNNGHDVSYYIIYEEGSTTSSITTTTTSSTITTEVTTPSSTTSTSVEGTTTSIETSTSTSPSTSASSTTSTDPELPFTGMDVRWLAFLSLVLLTVGATTLRAARR